MEKDEPNRSFTGRYASSKFRPKMASVTMSCVQKLFVGQGRFLSVMSDGPTRFGEHWTFSLSICSSGISLIHISFLKNPTVDFLKYIKKINKKGV